MEFVGRSAELERLEDWWRNWHRFALVWGRRRVGKTALISKFAEGRRTVFYTGTGLAEAVQLRAFSQRIAQALPHPLRSLAGDNPFRMWSEAFEYLAEQAKDEPLLLVLDEFPELLRAQPALPGVLRAFWDQYGEQTKLKVLICGSAVRTMFTIQTSREPLYGRFDLSLQLTAFSPAEAAQMLPEMAPADRAVAYGLVGGIPLYLSWWDQHAPLRDNLRQLCTQPSARLLTEGEFILSTEAGEGGLPGAILYAIANGRTKYQEIADTVGANPTRALKQLVDLRLIRPVTPVTADAHLSRRRHYRIVDNFLAFYLGPLARYRNEIEMGVGAQIVPALADSLAEHFGGVYEESFRSHLRRLAAAGALGERVVAIGEWWTSGGQDQIDAVVLAEPDRTRVPVAVGEVKWTRSVNANRVLRRLAPKAQRLTGTEEPDLKYVVCAREEVTGGDEDTYAVTAEDVFNTELRSLRPIGR